MKLLLFTILLSLSFSGISQVYGDISIAKREMLTDCDHKIPASAHEGQIFIAIAVDIDGNITSADLDMERSTVTHVILVREAKMRVKKMKYKAGYEWPKFHQGVVEFIVEKK